MSWQLIWVFSDLLTEGKRWRDEQWLGSSYGLECPYQLPSHYSSLYVLLSVHKSLNAHINFQVIVRLFTFYSQSTSHWMPISTSKSLFVSPPFTLSQQVTECPYQLPSYFSSLSVLRSIHKSLNAHINCPVIVRLSLFYSQNNDWEVDMGIQWLVDWE
jgi:hypothetical protein